VSTIVTDQGIVHYQTYGSGAPVILLHGWLGSWDTWRSTIEALGDDYRSYALDFWGFGESDKKREQFQVSDFVDLVNQFMDRLGIPSAMLVGHSMGGTVSMAAAIEHPERVQKVAVVGSPVNGRSLTLLLKPFVLPLVARLIWSSPALFRLGMRLIYAPLITHEARAFYEMTARNTSATTLESFFHSIASLHKTDLTPRLSSIRIPALGVYGARDVLVNPNQHKVFSAGIPQSQVMYMPGSGHFPMLDEPELFNQGLREFLAA
jgi:pimeloyl-ACP methyl ester carboxylesterase